VRACVLLMSALLLARGAAAQVPGVDLAAYRAAAAAGVVGAVAGRAYSEGRTPGDVERPIDGVVVVLVPRSADLVGRLEEIRTRARESQRAFLEAATTVRRAREAYEQRLWDAGFPELLQTAVADAGGDFALKDVPAGGWLLIGTRSVFVNKSSPKAPSRDREIFVPRLRLMGYYAVSVWLRDMTVSGGRTETVELVDRNVWFTGVVEDRMLDAGR
jgi:hypothetical protein